MLWLQGVDGYPAGCYALTLWCPFCKGPNACRLTTDEAALLRKRRTARLVTRHCGGCSGTLRWPKDIGQRLATAERARALNTLGGLDL